VLVGGFCQALSIQHALHALRETNPAESVLLELDAIEEVALGQF
jgi:hypothetical protein